MRALLAIIFAVLAACSGTPHTSPTAISNTGGAATGAHELLASIQRTACFGWCPIYKLTVYRDGTVEYEGEDYVKIKGKASGQLAPEQLSALDDLFQKAGYLTLHDKYTDYSVTDMPSVNTSYSMGGQTKKIEHYLGDDHAPPALADVEAGIDRIVHVEQWIGTEDERQKLSHRP